MQVGLHQFHSSTIEWLLDAAQSGQYSRTGLAQEVCVRENWRNPKGQYCVAQASSALPKLAAQLEFELPPPRAMPKWDVSQIRCDYEDVSLESSLEQLGPWSVELVSSEELGDWRAMVASYHPRGWVRIPGRQLHYWLVSSCGERLGGFSFHAASWHQKARDEHIGWSPRARAENLSLLINNTRFLLLPGVRVHGLASAALVRVMSRVAKDWHEAHGEGPLLAYSYVGAERRGTSYAAAGWQRVGVTSGRPPSAGGAKVEAKSVWMYALSEQWQVRLCAESGRQIGHAAAAYLPESADWAQQEFGRSTHPDGRIRARLVAMGRAWAHRPGEPVPVIFPNAADHKAATRLLSNPRVGVDDLLEPHQHATAQRVALERRVVVAQDTTLLNYNNLRRTTSDLVSIGGGGKGAKGVLAHVCLAISENHRPLGVLDINNQTRRKQQQEKESVRWVRGLDKSVELSRACENTQVINVCDREGDFWQLLAHQREAASEVGLVVRSSRGSQRRVALGEGQSQPLWEHLQQVEPSAIDRVRLAARGGRQARQGRVAHLELRVAKVQLLPPLRQRDEPSLPMVAVRATEVNPPHKKKGLDWLLLSTEGEADLASARRILQWYRCRWVIEEFFRVLKTGTRIERRMFDAADELDKCLVFDAVIACRVFSLERAARDSPQRAATDFVSKDDIFILYLELNKLRIIKCRAPPDWVPDIRTFVVDLGRFVGFRPSKRQALPGTIKIWQGVKHLTPAVNNYRTLKEMNMINSTPDSTVS